jgi:hypothetical protein
MNKNNEIFQPFNATFPVTDNLGQTIVSFGINKLQWAAVTIAGHIAANATAEMLDDTIVNYSVDIAEKVLNECEKRLTELTNNKTSLIHG